MPFKQQQLKQEDFLMNIVQDLGQVASSSRPTRKTRYAIFECPKCLIHFKARATGSAAKKQNSCQKCTRNKEQTYLHPLYAIWNGIRQRCYNIKRKDFHKYGGKGVVMYEGWKNDQNKFMEFCLTNGWTTSKIIDKDIKCRKLGINPPIYHPDTLSFISVQQNAEEANSKVVLQYDNNDVLVAEHVSCVKAALSLGKKAQAKSSIANCCRGISKTSYGFVWKYK